MQESPCLPAQAEDLTGKTYVNDTATVATVYPKANGHCYIRSAPSSSENNIVVTAYDDDEVSVRDQKEILVKLTPQANQLEEVVMVAYGAQKKASVIGSITSVEADQLKAPIGQLSTGLAGKLAGVVAVQHSGEPGSSAEFWIRGVNTFGATAMAAYTAGNRLEQLVQMPFGSMSMALSTYTSQNMGAGKNSRIREGLCHNLHGDGFTCARCTCNQPMSITLGKVHFNTISFVIQTHVNLVIYKHNLPPNFRICLSFDGCLCFSSSLFVVAL